MAAVPGIPPNIGAIAGPTLLGFMFEYAFFAILCLLVYDYFSSFPDDKIVSKLVVYSLFAITLTQTVLLTVDAWRMFATGYGNPLELLTVGFIWFSVPVTTSVVSMIVQIFFAYRLYLLSKSWLLGGFITCVSLTQGITGIVSGSQAHRINNFALLPTQAFVGTITWLTGSAVCDVIIAVSMIYFLSSRDTGFKETHNIIRRLVLLTIETGSVTAFLAIVTIVLFGVFPGQTYYTTPSIVMANSYAISAVVIFNNRTHFRRGASAGGASNELASTVAWARSKHNPGETTHGVGTTLDNGGIRVQQEQWSDSVEMNKVGTVSQDGYNSREIKLEV